MSGDRSKIRFRNWFDVAAFLLLSTLVTIALLSKLLQFYSFQISDWDTGIYSNLLWNFAAWRQKSLYLIQLLKALAYLPLASWRSLVCAAPLVALNLSGRMATNFRGGFITTILRAYSWSLPQCMVLWWCFVQSTPHSKAGRAIAAYMVLALIALLLTEPAATQAISSLHGSWFGDE